MIRQDLIVRGRNERFDVMKGIGITLNTIPAVAFMYIGYTIKDHSVSKVFFSNLPRLQALR